MKKLILPALVVMTLAACQKTKVNPGPSAVGKDTIPDGGSFKLQMATDSTGSEYPSNDTMNVGIHFNHAYHLDYSFYEGEDTGANDYNGFSGWDFTAISRDGGQLVADGVPYKPGVTIPLFITSAASRNNEQHFILHALNLANIPDDIHIWCKDNQLKDSADLRKGPFRFYFHRLDTASYGSNRLQIVLEPY